MLRLLDSSMVTGAVVCAVLLGCSSADPENGSEATGGGSGLVPGSGGSPGDPGGTGGTPDSSGGAPATGGESASGGNPGGEPARPYPHGFVPTTITSADADAAYAHWKEHWLVSCPDGVYRVEWDTANHTVSEGIAYGMLLAVAHDDREVFDGLWQYYKNNRNQNGFMHWRRVGCEGGQFDQNSNNGASDADLDAAMALVMAECRWGSEYGADATSLIAALLEHQTIEENGLMLLLPGDDKYAFSSGNCLNSSYFAPAYYRVFAERPSTSSADRERWTRLADDSYVLIERMAHPTTGLVPNWAEADGSSSPSGPSGCPWYNLPHTYGADAIRTPWRVSTDYVWWGTAEAKPWLDKVTNFVKSVGVGQVSRRYELDGTPIEPQEHSVMAVGAFATGAMASDQATIDEFAAAALAIEEETRYFPDSLRALYFLQLTGRFTSCGGAE